MRPNLNNLFFLVLILSVLSCNKDDDESINVDPCDFSEDSITSGVEQVKLSVIGNESSPRGYLITANIQNNNNNAVNGVPRIVLNINNINVSHTPLGCREIKANSTCEIKSTLRAEENEPIDNNVEFLCFLYLN